MRFIEFNIKYEVNDGSVMYLVYRLDDNGDITNGALSLRELQHGWWQGSLEVPEDYSNIVYGYELLSGGKVVASEWSGTPHTLRFNCINRNYIVYDMWLNSPVGYYSHTNLFRFFNDNALQLDEPSINWYNRSVTFSLYATGLRKGERLYLVGEADVLGNWNPSDALPMQQRVPNRWSVTFDVATLWSGSLRYKFIAIDNEGNVRWEEGDNRHILLPDFEPATNYFYQLDELNLPSENLRIAGTVIPLFSLRSAHGWGIGDFGDIRLMADWLASTGQNILQLLPVNDTTVCGGNEDSYPYNCVSVYALNPIYADMSQLPALGNEKRNAWYQKEGAALNQLAKVNYAKVYMLKIGYLRELFDEAGADILAGEAYKDFAFEQEVWLKPYTLFRFLSARLHCNMQDWGEYSRYDKTTWGKVVAEYPDALRETSFYSFVQYILYTQLSEAHQYANSRGVALKGDIPIGVAPNGVDVWCDSEQFNLSVSAGAPPDMFSADGQNWGFPTYNWQVMAGDGFAWWRRRLQYMSHFFDAYRIDHILGFFRIWEIPRTTQSGLLGSFSPNMPLSIDEMAEYGFLFEKRRHTVPYVDNALLKELFPRRVKQIIEAFFDEQPDGTYIFKAELENSNLLAYYIYERTPKLPQAMRDALLRLYGSVLFLPDLNEEEKFVPRILGRDTAAYLQLSQEERIAYDRIYEDYYYNRHTMFWYREGMRKLAPLLESTTMTACGEDLGMIPACVPWVMKNLQVLSLEIQRMPKLFGETFADTSRYPYLSVATPSTHDMSTLRGWWREDRALSQQFYNNVLGFEGEAPEEMDGSIAHSVLMQHLDSPSAFALFAWQDWMAMDERLRCPDPDGERINVPSNRNHVWNYRMHIAIEQLMEERAFNGEVRRMITESGRLV
ncbi:MAG: 4-alpha-glucanotransferase [Bacteroidaceae bacterium]|nr:4-alpha-glucanotransferase [Bacteroidaceae bacterium]